MPPLTAKAKLMVLGRVGLAVGCALAPELVVRALGFRDRSSTTATFARMLGVRDLAVALAIVASAGDREAHQRVLQIAGLVDVGDVAAIAFGALADPALRRAAVVNTPFAGGSAIFAFLAAAEMGRGGDPSFGSDRPS